MALILDGKVDGYIDQIQQLLLLNQVRSHLGVGVAHATIHSPCPSFAALCLPADPPNNQTQPIALQSSADKAKFQAANKWATTLQQLQQTVLTKLA